MTSSIAMGRQALGLARGLRRLVRNPVGLAEAQQVVADELAHREQRFLDHLERLVWPLAHSPSRRLLEHAGLDRAEVAQLVHEHGLDDALDLLRAAGVYVSYEEYQGRATAVRGSSSFDFCPADFLNPVTPGDYLSATGGSRSAGAAMEVSFAYQRRQSVTRRLQMSAYGLEQSRVAIWLPVFPSAAGFGAVMKWAAAGNVPAAWFSQVPIGVRGITGHKQVANRFLPQLHALTGAGLPSPRHVPSSEPAAVVQWLVEQVARGGPVTIVGYASSLAAAGHYATRHGIDLTGVHAFPGSEPVTTGKLSSMRAAGMTATGTYAFTPEGIMAMGCPHDADEEYHVWDHEMAVVTRRRARSDGADVDALLWTSLSEQAPRVLLNVENDDYADVLRDGASCDCALGRLGLRTRLRGIRGLSKVVTAGIAVDGEAFDDLVGVLLPDRLGGAVTDYQFVEVDGPTGTSLALRISPRVGDVDLAAAVDVVRGALRRNDNGVLADEVWGGRGGLTLLREEPTATKAGKTLALERSPMTPAGRLTSPFR